VVLDYSNKLQNSSYSINRLRQSDLIKGQINTTNINKLSRSSNDGLLGNGKELRI